MQFNLDPVGVACDGFVHRVVEHFGHKVMERAFIGAADIHAGAFADGFQPFEHLDRGGVVGLIAGAGQEVFGHSLLFSCSVGRTIRQDGRVRQSTGRNFWAGRGCS